MCIYAYIYRYILNARLVLFLKLYKSMNLLPEVNLGIKSHRSVQSVKISLGQGK